MHSLKTFDFLIQKGVIQRRQLNAKWVDSLIPATARNVSVLEDTPVIGVLKGWENSIMFAENTVVEDSLSSQQVAVQ